MKIVKQGDKHLFEEEKECKCGTKFKFGNSDVRCWDESGPYVRCPICGEEHFLNGSPLFCLVPLFGLFVGIIIMVILPNR